MKKLARNSLLAITAMAWLGQPVVADTKRGDGGSTQIHMQQSSEGERQPSRGYSASDRALLRSHFRQAGATDAGSTALSSTALGNTLADAAALSAGDTLDFDALRNARTLPADIRNRLAAPATDTQDLLIGHQAVRLTRDTRVVIDTVTLQV
ncbi:hypothetical protein K8B33_05815 [Alcanivorax sp. JB21]|uniref:hypothetical protein n=1 Tax=Alcanivorax limicola TaxID=2874102 RepID=UPI001CBEAD14|nr:hypothetical protein [Alcanivorax limicola]MBZ2188601.1 hypothetical protein [Alcanivorax limicola]